MRCQNVINSYLPDSFNFDDSFGMHMKPGNLFSRISDPLNLNTGKSVYSASLLLILLVILTYSGAVRNSFVDWDDNDYVVNNKMVRSGGTPDLPEIFSTVVSLNYHPLTILSLSLNDNTCKECPNGISARPFIFSNIVLHALNTILVFILIYLLFKKNLVIAFIVAAIFGVHPMHVESVAWVSGRKDVLNSFFFLSGLISYFIFLKTDRRKYLWMLFTFFLFVLACLSKATAIVFPVIALLINYIIIAEEERIYGFAAILKAVSFRRILQLLPFFAFSVFFGLMAVSIQNGHNFLGMLKFIKAPHDVINTVAPLTILLRLQVASYGFFVYAVKFFIPVKQSVFYPYPGLNEMISGNFSLLLWLSLLAMIAVVTLIIISMRKTGILIFCFGFYLVTLVMVLQFVSVGNAILAERYTYLPYIGLAIIPAFYIVQGPGKTRKYLFGVCAFFIIILLLLARKQIKVWHDSETLWSQVIERHPNLELARSARGKYYYMLSSHAANDKEKRILEDKAIIDFTVAIKENSGTADVYEGMGVILQSRNDLKTALQLLNVAVKLNPEKGRTYYNRAMIFDKLNQKESAIDDYVSALNFSPEMALEVLRNRSVLYIETGQYEKAISDLNGLIRIDGKEYTHYYNRAFSRVMIKDYIGAIADYKIVLLLRPGDRATMEQLRLLQEYQKKK